MGIGEVYFIRERDRSTGRITENVKIGMVSKKGESNERLKEHQTGNPRDLVLHHVAETPAPFWVENGLHQRLDATRVRNEWHKLEGTVLEDAVRLAETLAAESFVHVPFIDEEDRLRKCVSNGQIIDPTEESNEWQLRLSRAKAQLDLVSVLRKAYKDVIAGLSEEEVELAQLEDLFYIEHYLDTRFDEDAFLQKYPEIFSKYITSETEVKGRLTPSYLDLKISEFDPNLESFSQEFTALCERVTRQEVEFGELRDLESTLQLRENVFSWEKEISTAHLATICGLANGIKDQLTWKRSEKVTDGFDKELLESIHPNEYNEFITVTQKTRQKTRKRARRSTAAID